MLLNNAKLASLCLIGYPDANSPDLQPSTRRVICKMPFFRKVRIVQKRKEQVIYFLRATIGDKVVCSCTNFH